MRNESTRAGEDAPVRLSGRLGLPLHGFPLLGLLVATVMLMACGGSGGSGAVPARTDLGTFASTRPTVVPVDFVNPLAQAATVTQADASGAFSIEPTDVPDIVEAGSTHSLGVRFAPVGAGLVTGSITLRYAGATRTELVTHLLQARGEAVIWELATSPIEFGTVELDAFSDRVVEFRNASTLSPVTLTGNVQAPTAAYSVVGDPFPLTIDPSASASLVLRFAPTTPGSHSGVVRIGAGGATGTLDVPVTAAAPGEGAETVVEFGTQSLAGNLTPRLTIDVPADALSLTVEGYDPTRTTTLGLGELIGPGDKVYENVSLTGEYVWTEGAEVFATTLPNTDRADVQLVPGGGTYTFRIRRLSGFGNQVSVRAIIETRGQTSAGQGSLDLNVWLANGLPLSAAMAANDARLQNILARIDAILASQGVRLGDIDYYDVANPGFDEVLSDGEFGQMLRTTSEAAAVRLNLFFVEVALGGRVVGAAATITGPKRNGTSLSGVMSVYDNGLSANVIGMIAAHEIGHFLGLYHTVDQDGSHDFVDDTANCPPSGTNAECPETGGGYLMHWQAIGGSTITDGQGGAVRAHPLMAPSSGQAAAANAKFRPAPIDLLDLAQAAALPQDWCGCCRAPGKPALESGTPR